MIKLELTDEEFILVRLAVALKLPFLYNENQEALISLAEKIVTSLREQNEMESHL
jgi:hypothetical protein